MISTLQNLKDRSEGYDVEQAVLKAFPGAVGLRKSSLSEDKNGTDYLVLLECGREDRVDVKVRDKDGYALYGQDDVAVETWAVMENGVGKKVGWTRDKTKQTEHVLWIWRPTMRTSLWDFLQLCHVTGLNWEKWREIYKTEIQHTRRGDGTIYESECVFVPTQVIYREIVKHFSGRIHSLDPYLSRAMKGDATS